MSTIRGTCHSYGGVVEYYTPTNNPQKLINKLAEGAEVLGFSHTTFPKHGWEYLGELLKQNDSITKLSLDTTELDEQTREITKQKGIEVMTIHDYYSHTRAECAIESILTTSHETLGIEVRGRSLGVIGEGKAGEETAELGKKLGMSVSMWSSELVRMEGIKRKSVREILTTSEFIAIAVQDSEANRELLDRSGIEQIHEEACVVNVAGKNVVNEQVIKGAVKDGRIGAYVYKPIPDTKEARERRVAEFVKHVTGLAGVGSS